jgi:hypothetical protein
MSNGLLPIYFMLEYSAFATSKTRNCSQSFIKQLSAYYVRLGYGKLIKANIFLRTLLLPNPVFEGLLKAAHFHDKSSCITYILKRVFR